jgi:hypothetical protein
MNQLLAQTRQGILSKINPPNLAPAVQKIEQMGQQIMYSPQSRDLVVSQLSKGVNQPHVIGEGIAKVLGMVFHASKGTMPPKIAIPAATLMLCDGLDMLEQSGKVHVTPDFLAQCMQEMTSSVLQLFGVTPQKLQQYFAQAQAKGAIPGAQQPNQPAQGGLIASVKGNV